MFDGTLATKGPWQALVTFQQFLILADRAGIVDMTPEAISRRTTVPIEVIEVGIAALEIADPESRSPAEDGRRITRLSDTRTWGWQITNYATYRDLRSADDRRDYMRKYQADKRAGLPPGERAKTPATPRTNGAGTHAPDEQFAAFWSLYPSRKGRKSGKAAALSAWRKLKPDSVMVGTILQAVRTQAASTEWTKESGGYVPDAHRWLAKKRWQDEVVAVAGERESDGLRRGVTGERLPEV